MRGRLISRLRFQVNPWFSVLAIPRTRSYDGSMLEQIVVAVVSAVILGVLAQFLGLFRVGKNVRTCMTEINRAKKDYGAWAERARRHLIEKIRQIDEDHNARGIYHSGIRRHAGTQAMEEMRLLQEAELRVLSRRISDAFDALRPIDRAWLAIKTKDRGDYSLVKAVWIALTKPPRSMEDEILDPVLEMVKEDTAA